MGFQCSKDAETKIEVKRNLGMDFFLTEAIQLVAFASFLMHVVELKC